MLTLVELKEKIVEQIDEVDLIDYLHLTTEDLVNAFEEKIEECQENLERELELPEFEE